MRLADFCTGDHIDGNVHDRVLLLVVEDYFGTPASIEGLKERIQTWMADAAAGPDALPHYGKKIAVVNEI